MTRDRDFYELLHAAHSSDSQRVRDRILRFLPELLDYDAASGTLTWKTRDRRWFASDGAHAAWNGRYAGKPALATVKNHGYKCGAILGVYFLAHRVIWAIANGQWPTECDHINGVRTDNRLVNLRDVDKSGNQRNSRLRSDNTSGRVGVYRVEDRGQWGACIFAGGRLRHLGFFTRFEQAVTARAGAERQYGFHQNHGRRVEHR